MSAAALISSSCPHTRRNACFRTDLSGGRVRQQPSRTTVLALFLGASDSTALGFVAGLCPLVSGLLCVHLNGPRDHYKQLFLLLESVMLIADRSSFGSLLVPCFLGSLLALASCHLGHGVAANQMPDPALNQESNTQV